MRTLMLSCASDLSNQVFNKQEQNKQNTLQTITQDREFTSGDIQKYYSLCINFCDGRSDKGTNRWTDGWTDGRTNGRMDNVTCKVA